MGVLMRVVDRVMVLITARRFSEGLPSAVAGDPRVIEVYLGTDADVRARLRRRKPASRPISIRACVRPPLAARFRRRSLARIRVRAEIDSITLDRQATAARQAFGNLLRRDRGTMTRSTTRIKHAHDVLDPDDGEPEFVADLAQHVGGLVHLVLVEPAEALVGEQQFGPVASAFASSSFFKPAAPRPSTLAWRSVGKPTMRSARSAASSALARLLAALAVIAGERDVLEHTEPCVKRPAGSGRYDRYRY